MKANSPFTFTTIIIIIVIVIIIIIIIIIINHGTIVSSLVILRAGLTRACYMSCIITHTCTYTHICMYAYD